MPSLFTKVKAKMDLYAHEKVRSLLDGQYGSVFKGRSLDFDDLREYIPGDDVKDIDWKATARSSGIRIRRYQAIRKHNILLVVDTGRHMAATSKSGSNKRDISIMTAGVLGYIVLRHGDLIGLVSGDAKNNAYIPFKGDDRHIELLLRHIEKSTQLAAAPSNIMNQLEYIARNLRRKMMLVVVANDDELTGEHQHIIRRLRAQHEILWITVNDTSGLDGNRSFYDIDDLAELPYFIRKQTKLQTDFDRRQQLYYHEYSTALERLGVISERISGEEDVVGSFFSLLERQKHARWR